MKYNGLLNQVELCIYRFGGATIPVSGSLQTRERKEFRVNG